MNIKKFIDRLLHNWPIKLLCLVVAIFLYIFHQASLVDHKNFVVPLKVIENGEVMHVQQLPDSISISVRALPDDISNIHADDISASLDLSHLTDEGEFEVPVTVTVSEKLKTFEALEIKVKPNHSMKVSVQKKVARYIPLKPSVSGEPAYGYQVESVTIDPATVCVIGPQSIVSKINEIYTDKVVVSNAETNFTTEVNYLQINKMVVVYNKGPYKATVKIAPVEATKLYSDVPVIPLYLSETLMLDGNISSVNMNVGGTVPVLENYIPGKNVLQIDLSQISDPGEYDIPVTAVLPGYLTLESLSQETVHVKVIEQPQIEETITETQE